MFPVGILTTLVGIFVLSQRGNAGQEAVGVGEEDPEERKGLVDGSRNSVDEHRDRLGRGDHLKYAETAAECSPETSWT